MRGHFRCGAAQYGTVSDFTSDLYQKLLCKKIEKEKKKPKRSFILKMTGATIR